MDGEVAPAPASDLHTRAILAACAGAFAVSPTHNIIVAFITFSNALDTPRSRKHADLAPRS